MRKPSIVLFLTACSSPPTNIDKSEQAISVLLFSDAFDGDPSMSVPDPLLSRWTAVDEGTISASSAWARYQGTVRQTSNIYGNSSDPAGISKPGTYFVAGDAGWTDYSFSARMLSGDNDDIGLMFRVADATHYYRFAMNKETGYRKLEKRAGSTWTTLASSTAGYTTGQWYTVEVRAQGSALSVTLDGALILSASDSAIPAGRIALYDWGNVNSQFDDVAVTALSTGLLADNFGSASLGTTWKIVDEGTNAAPSAWSVSGGVLHQTSNIWGGNLTAGEIGKPGTYVHGGNARWTDYDFTATMKSSDNDGMGLMFRYQGPWDYYRFTMNSSLGFRRLERNRGGVFTVLATASGGYNLNQSYTVTVQARGSSLIVLVDGVQILQALDDKLQNGEVALYSWGNTGVQFDNVSVVVPASADSTQLARQSCAYGPGAPVATTLGDVSALRANIKHVIIVTQENRSVDHMFGTHGGDVEGTPPGYANHGTAPSPATSLCLTDPTHNWSAIHGAWDNGRMDAFDTSTGGSTLTYFNDAAHPFYSWALDHFATSDRYFCDVLSMTYPNRDFLYAATSGGLESNSATLLSTGVPLLFDSLTAHGITWADYTEGSSFLDGAIGWTGSEGFVRSQAQLAIDLADGTLPQVAFVDSDPDDSEHPSHSIADGETFVRNLVMQVMASPQWGETALIINYDEGGGFFDHVPPPPACLPDPSQTDFDHYGMRVPLFVISPWARPGFVSHQFHSHTSVTRFVEAAFDLPALTARDANADALLDLFDFTAPHPAPRPVPASHAAGCAL